MKITIVSSEGVEWAGEASTTPPSPSPKYKGWRCLHQAEGGYPNPNHMPVVRPSLNIASIPFNQPMQKASFYINRKNPKYTGSKWRSTYNGGTAFTNNQGFDDPDAGPRADYINLRDLTSPLPKLMKGIICGGNFHTGTPTSSLIYGIQEFFKVLRLSITHPKELMKMKRSTHLVDVVNSSMRSITSQNVLTMTPGVNAIDATKPISNIAAWVDLIETKIWYFVATTRATDKINNFPQGGGSPVYITYFLSKPAMYPLNWFEPWVADSLPDPLRIYHPV